MSNSIQGTTFEITGRALRVLWNRITDVGHSGPKKCEMECSTAFSLFRIHLMRFHSDKHYFWLLFSNGVYSDFRKRTLIDNSFVERIHLLVIHLSLFKILWNVPLCSMEIYNFGHNASQFRRIRPISFNGPTFSEPFRFINLSVDIFSENINSVFFCWRKNLQLTFI